CWSASSSSSARSRSSRRSRWDRSSSISCSLPDPEDHRLMSTHAKARPLLDPAIVRGAIVDSLRKLDPRVQVRNPVMFVVLVGSVLTTALFLQALVGRGEAPAWFIFAVSLWLWFTVLFANFAEAMAEGRGKAQAESLKRARRDLTAKKLAEA